MRVDVVRGGPATVVHVAGELDAASAPELGDVLEAVGRDARMVALDLGATSFIDSAGIRVLVRSLWDIQDAGSTLRLVAASPAAENILRITGILDVLKDPKP
ncbi:STAS domain-containing protein [Aquihabitans daechungensis]|uniref:STAS domain-containing protein n=1 Tax=Aquihabitans daechungensis TaxID=1052257 RepID=UPI003BA290FC